MLPSLGNILKTRRRRNIRFLPVTQVFRPGRKKEQNREFFVFQDKEAFMKTYGLSLEPKMLSHFDFAKAYLIAIHQGMCPTGGYRISVEDFTRNKGEVEITVRFVVPAPSEKVTLAMTSPTVFFPVRRRTKEESPPVFRFRSADGTLLKEHKPDFSK